MEKKIEQMLDLMTDIVNDDKMRWAEKRDLIKSEVAKSEYYETAFEEFRSWFE